MSYSIYPIVVNGWGMYVTPNTNAHPTIANGSGLIWPARVKNAGMHTVSVGAPEQYRSTMHEIEFGIIAVT